MKRIAAIALIALSLLTTPAFADDPYLYWVWLNGSWVWVGSGDPSDPPPPIRG